MQVPFFWLSSYEGRGNPQDWDERQRADFLESGAKFVRVGDMAHGLDRLTRGAVERVEDPDPHFCMPGNVWFGSYPIFFFDSECAC